MQSELLVSLYPHNAIRTPRTCMLHDLLELFNKSSLSLFLLKT